MTGHLDAGGGQWTVNSGPLLSQADIRLDPSRAGGCLSAHKPGEGAAKRRPVAACGALPLRVAVTMSCWNGWGRIRV